MLVFLPSPLGLRAVHNKQNIPDLNKTIKQSIMVTTYG